MKIKKSVVTELVEQLDAILAKMHEDEVSLQPLLEELDESYHRSAQNLVHYMAFRSFDVRKMQKHLKNLGLTRFANSQAHIKASVLNIRYLLGLVLAENEKEALRKHWSIKKGEKLLTRNTKNLLGYRSKGRRVRIMVTQPTEAAYNYELVKMMVQKGMNCARINCAHDSPEVWAKMIANIRRASAEFDRRVKISMDLAGPKIRTGLMSPGPKVVRCKPDKDAYGSVGEPLEVRLVPQDDYQGLPNTIPVGGKDAQQPEQGDILKFRDARDKKRSLHVVSVEDNQIITHAWKTIYFTPDLVLQSSLNEAIQLTVGDLPAAEQAIVLREGDELMISKNELLGSNAQTDESGQVVRPAEVSCQMPQVFDYIQAGDRIFFDDGKIGGKIAAVNAEVFTVNITQARENGSKLRAYKGINFPDSKLGFSGLTEKDRKDLEFVAQHADIVNFSFVNRPEDVEELYRELKRLGVCDKIGVIFKIETRLGFDNLVPILLEGMKFNHIGVMIARGDLAIETGWENIGQIQQDMLSICGAAHVPVVWATQVLESLAKTGLPSRSEITDATTALRAECVMLNKGPYIHEAIGLLNTILSKTESKQNKDDALLPRLESQVISEKV
ncbi:MAG: pyruvate kinase [Bacteroidota bacterium]